MGTDLKFDNILNVRDFGGQMVVGGGSVKTGKLFRGAQLSNMSSKDRSKLSSLGISLLVDMRYRSERERQSTQLDSKFNPQMLTLLPEHDQKDEDGLAPHEMFIINELGSADDARRYMVSSYTDRPKSPAFVSITSRSLKLIANRNDTLYVHCAVGKDRTGTFVAILLMLLGVSAEAVMQDYMRTREAVALHLLIEMISKKMEERYGRPYDSKALQPFLGVDPDFLAASLGEIGEINNYASKVLGLTKEDIASLREHYISS